MAPTDAPQIRVLVVDDEEDFATALVARLTRRGFEAVPAFSGREALAILARREFDVVLLDLKMPEMDGLTTLQEARKLDPTVAVVVLTGHGNVSSGVQGMQLGAVDFLQKPVSIEVLCDVIKATALPALGSRRNVEGEGGLS